MTALWITEAVVAELLDLSGAIDALEVGLRDQANGAARSMAKTHLPYEGGALHALGAWSGPAGLVATKTWSHTAAGASPLLVVWRAETGDLEAVIEAFALGQMRTGAVSGVATRYMAQPSASVLALIGAGKQALAQAAAVAAVRDLAEVRIFSRSAEKREDLARRVTDLVPAARVTSHASVAEAVAGASICTLATRASNPILSSGHLSRGTHINAIGAITPEREEFSQDIFDRADWLAADDPTVLSSLSREFITRFGDRAAAEVVGLADLVARDPGRPAGGDLSVFKAMGMGLSDLSLGAEILRRARSAGLGRPLAPVKRVAPRLASTRTDRKTNA